ncbi:hypothetical protein [Scytonema sp. PRP1]|uniref:hypothetical protein n=1 Tax=Scytonema sp. PRP1 TaxID=3120513 RepID=UPI00300CDBC3
MRSISSSTANAYACLVKLTLRLAERFVIDPWRCSRREPPKGRSLVEYSLCE